MSPPDTDLKKEERRHKPALIGMVLAAAAVVIIVIAVNVFGAGDEVDEATSGEMIESE